MSTVIANTCRYPGFRINTTSTFQWDRNVVEWLIIALKLDQNSSTEVCCKFTVIENWKKMLRRLVHGEIKNIPSRTKTVSDMVTHAKVGANW